MDFLKELFWAILDPIGQIAIIVGGCFIVSLVWYGFVQLNNYFMKQPIQKYKEWWKALGDGLDEE